MRKPTHFIVVHFLLGTMKPDAPQPAILLRKSVLPNLVSGLLLALALRERERRLKIILYLSMLGTSGQRVRT